MPVLQTAQATWDRLRALPSNLSQQQDFGEATASMLAGTVAAFDGVWGSSRALLAAALQQSLDRPLLVVFPDDKSAVDFAGDVGLFTTAEVMSFPAWEAEPSRRLVYDDTYCDRLRLLKRLAQVKRSGKDQQPNVTPPAFIAASMKSLLQPIPPLAEVAENTHHLAVGQQVDIDDFLRWLTDRGFHSTSAVELPGEFSSRGGIIDVFAADWIRPIRIEFFDDEIESIRGFDVESQRSITTHEEIEVTVLTPHRGNGEHLASFLPDATALMVVENARCDENGKQYLERVEHVEEYHSVNAVMQSLATLPTAMADSLTQGDFGTRCRLQIESVQRFEGEFGEIRTQLDTAAADRDVYIVAVTEAEIERLTELLQTTNLAATGRLHFVEGVLAEGFSLPSEACMLLSANQLFHRGELRRPPRRHLGKAIDSFVDLREGDLIVHLSHGIGRYRGLEMIAKEGQVEEHLAIEFRHNTKIYVPAAKIGLVQKYIGGSKTRPTLATIGGKAWSKQKKAAQSAVIDMAAEMLELQAERALRPGIAFREDTHWQHEFDASFPHQETPDQLTAIAAIKGDMQQPRPMDRLLCGDVGYGKTEVAMRAAFKAVESGYQVAVMAPTTILVEQHYRTFRERSSEFPLDIGKLSRFVSGRQQKETIRRLADGNVDICIGTHRLASRDVKFQNLGLVIIDEEQRFGVDVKERLKTLRSSVDVLTMSATPIPRTLHMSLVGVRDISNLETPPEERVGVETRVTRFDEELIRRAVLRELNRGGQIYFVHNRVGDIREVAGRLQNIVPEASIRIGHGQMPEGELEEVMYEFMDGQFDILCATTIVESGLDIPNANTIFIDEADRYGLADLHQLRGRVGRYRNRAYAYLLVDPHKHLNPNAARRLRAIEEFSEMGAGFAISMRDLEIRGAGNLLGTQQSGHIAAIGYELYCQLLETAVRKMQNKPLQPSIDVDIDFPGSAFLPDDYVTDGRTKIDIYRRLARLNGYDQIEGVRDELIDRFGALPPPVKRLLSLAELRLDAAVWQLVGLRVEGDFLALDYGSRTRVEQLAKQRPGLLRIADEKTAFVKLKEGMTTKPNAVLKAARSVLRVL